ncbi:MAG: patatin-like phospholipase family protein [Paracoccus sp. (in: a-proteobacteria)]|uniref:patatin-like phospholipase family protein n=1 Tax=Paracoccus sp. TaxID=267 RepID=UPI0026DF525B|nr:patatin-like phospholipase family protein [Paracoccus sp. (in: a-proteobacteria)]MDO5631544.1 patatin-like phospholipase family protein [Paracoccus sp. (in: a-proteobacteria)]
MKDKYINLALQGGGAHGAFTWGVIDRLLDEDWLHIEGITGTSAGAMNGAALKAGLVAGSGAGRRAARVNLAHLWSEVGQASDNRVVRWIHSMFPVPRQFERLAEMFSPFAWMDNLTRVISPYDYGPFYVNPLGSILKTLPYPDFSSNKGPRFFVTATNVRTGRVKIFTGDQATPEAVMASACLPTLFRAVEITDPKTGISEAYWDGGYSGNPALFPLYTPDLPRDIVIVNINPMRRDSLPKTPAAIHDRLNEVSFNAALLSELRAISFVKRLFEERRTASRRIDELKLFEMLNGLFDEKRLANQQMKDVLVHMILDDELMTNLTARTKIMPAPGLLEQMMSCGQDAADRWLDQNADALNHRDTVDLRALFS